MGDKGISRRGLIAAGAFGVAGGAALGVGGTALALDAERPDSGPEVGTATVPFYGEHQAGVETPPPAHGLFFALDLKKGTDADRFARIMRLLTDDAARLTQGRAPLADTEPELAELPSNLTVTFGFGPSLFAKLGREDAMPENFAGLPAYESIDRLEDRWSGGDLLVQVCADDLMAVAHAQRMLLKDSRSFLGVRWVQRGFRNSAGVVEPEKTQRNVMGQLDGSANPRPGSEEFRETVWAGGSGPFAGGTTLALRRIRVDLETWDKLDVGSKEVHVGRRLADGAPLTGGKESDDPDLEAKENGLEVISPNAHVRRSTAPDGRKIYRRAYNYDDGPTSEGTSETGLLFASYQADLEQFTVIQERLAESDLLNNYTTPVGSAVFAIPPGCEEGGWAGETLF
ncbi:Dyp-type peroxidase [Salininema proteolyticum]|uniref:Dyp-type peroxidase n=1 Tax=Salininema proteolyticum TaxID=1607685 RepID=A0ABV8TZ67_9ACTN